MDSSWKVLMESRYNIIKDQNEIHEQISILANTLIPPVFVFDRAVEDDFHLTSIYHDSLP